MSLESAKRWNAANKEKALANGRAYYWRNAEYLRAIGVMQKRAYRAEGRYLESDRARAVRRRAYCYQLTMERKEKVRIATPVWVDRAEVARVFATAQKITGETGVSYSVDHVIPIKHALVCGLHVPWNLQVMTTLANRRKNNQWRDDGVTPTDVHAAKSGAGISEPIARGFRRTSGKDPAPAAGARTG